MALVIGISAYFHESSLALFDDGELVYFAREEYFSRIKGDYNFPRLALTDCIARHQIKNEQIERVVFYEKPLRNFLFVLKEAYHHFPKSSALIVNKFMRMRHTGLFFFADLNKYLQIPRSKISFCPHHLSHALSGVPFTETHDEPYISLVIDGFGDVYSTSAYLFRGGDITLLDAIRHPHSLGLLYSAVTDYLGFKINEGEYKVMALAAYGDNSLNQKFDRLCRGETPGQLNLEAFEFHRSIKNNLSEKFYQAFGKPRNPLADFPEPGSEEFQKWANIACALQNFLETQVTELINALAADYQISRFSLTGGVALNSKLISVINKLDSVSELSVPPNPGDSGAAIGAGLFGVLIENQDQNIATVSPFLGPEPQTDNDLLEHFFTKICDDRQAFQEAASLISSGNPLVVFDSRIEVGPRALGHRSIVCDPRNTALTQKVSTGLKGRESFRPLAPAVLAQDAGIWFDIGRKYNRTLSWMGSVVNVQDRTLRELPAICHVDATARVQLVDDRKSALYKLLLEFKTQTDVAVLVNTSFNCGGDPIVLDLSDCIVSMSQMSLKYALINGSLVALNEKSAD